MLDKKLRDEQGLVSFTVTIIMMLVISLIVIGFTQVTANNRREQLDRQLSLQAFYAAESGVNAAIADIQADPNSIGTVNACGAPVELGSNSGISYTCVLVNPIVPDITIPASEDRSEVVKIEPVKADGTNLNVTSVYKLSFTWSKKAGGSAPLTKCGPSGTFKTTDLVENDPDDFNDTNDPCGYPMLRVDLMQQPPNPQGDTAVELANSTLTFFMQPIQSGSGELAGVSDWTVAPRSYLLGAECDEVAGTCTGRINLGNTDANKTYYARVSTLYGATERVVIDGTNNSLNDSYFAGVQAEIDATGRAQDVLRRVKVRVPISGIRTDLTPNGAIESDASIEKQFNVYDGWCGGLGCN